MAGSQKVIIIIITIIIKGCFDWLMPNTCAKYMSGKPVLPISRPIMRWSLTTEASISPGVGFGGLQIKTVLPWWILASGALRATHPSSHAARLPQYSRNPRQRETVFVSLSKEFSNNTLVFYYWNTRCFSAGHRHSPKPHLWLVEGWEVWASCLRIPPELEMELFSTWPHGKK